MTKDTQPYLPVKLTPVKGSTDYNNFYDFYKNLNTILLESGLDLQFSLLYIEAIKLEKEAEAAKTGETYTMSSEKRLYYQQQGIEAFRCNFIREREGLSYVDLSKALGSNTVLQKFCNLLNIKCIFVPSKSQLHRYATLVSPENLTKLHNRFNTVLYEDQHFLDDIKSGDLYLDSTCVKAQMHHPVDWVLLRDACRTMLKAVSLIRDAGVKCRMKSPDKFMSEMNGLCIKMAGANRKHDNKKSRKAALRELKILTKTIAKHADSHLIKFEMDWESSAYTQGQARNIMNRLEGIVEITPQIIKQAHERIIGERLVDNADKILSLYQDNVHVITRRKAEAHNEFGSQLLIAEQKNGFIVDFIFEKEKISNDSKMLPTIIENYESNFGESPESITTDRGFSSPKNTKILEDKKVFNAICPKSPTELQ